MSYLPIEDHGDHREPAHGGAGWHGRDDRLVVPAGLRLAERVLLDPGRREGRALRAASRRVHAQPAALSARHQRAPDPLLLAGGPGRDPGLHADPDEPARRPPQAGAQRAGRSGAGWISGWSAGPPSTTPARDHSVSVGRSGAVFSSGRVAASGWLTATCRWRSGTRGAAGARFALGEGERATFVLADLERG